MQWLNEYETHIIDDGQKVLAVNSPVTKTLCILKVSLQHQLKVTTLKNIPPIHSEFAVVSPMCSFHSTYQPWSENGPTWNDNWFYNFKLVVRLCALVKRSIKSFLDCLEKARRVAHRTNWLFRLFNLSSNTLISSLLPCCDRFYCKHKSVRSTCFVKHSFHLDTTWHTSWNIVI